MLAAVQVGVGTGLLLWVLWMALVATPAAVISALKGQWLWLALGFFTAGIAWIWGALQPAKPGSVWQRRAQSRSLRQ